MSRRSLIKTLLSSPLTLGLPSTVLPSVLMRSAFAAEEKPPIRTLFIYHPNGAVPDIFHPKAGSLELPGMTAPLESVKQHCVFMDGIGLDGRGTTHEGGAAKILTGNHVTIDNLRATSSSIDVMMGVENFTNGHTPIAPSIQMGLFASKWSDKTISYQGHVRLPYFDDPLTLYANIFSGLGGDQGSQRSLANFAAFNAANADLQRLRAQLGSIEGARLDMHMDAFSQLEAKLQALATNSQGVQCGEVDLTGIGVRDWKNEIPTGPMSRVSDAQQDIAVQAFSCDVTRVISFMYSHAVSPITNPTGGMGDHDASHSDAATHLKSKVWWMAEIAKFIQKLADTPDGENTSLLDNTLVLLVSDLGHGNWHDHWRVPFVLAGGSSTGLKLGRSLDFRGNGTETYGWGEELGQGHANLLQLIAQRAGYQLSIPLATGVTPKVW